MTDYDKLGRDELLAELDRRLAEVGCDSAILLEDEGDAVVFGQHPFALVRLWMAAADDRYDHQVEHTWMLVEPQPPAAEYETLFRRCKAGEPGAEPATWGEATGRRVEELKDEELRDWLRELDAAHRAPAPGQQGLGLEAE